MSQEQMIANLLLTLPYPRHFYDTINASQIFRMYQKYVLDGKKVKHGH